MPLGHTNGVVTGYRVFYIDAAESQAKLNITVESANVYSAKLTGLLRYTNYCIQVLAFTSQGNGNISDCLITLTREDGKGVNHFMPLVRFKVRSHCKLKVANSCWHFQVCECEHEFQPTIICVNCCVNNSTNKSLQTRAGIFRFGCVNANNFCKLLLCNPVLLLLLFSLLHFLLIFIFFLTSSIQFRFQLDKAK